MVSLPLWKKKIEEKWGAKFRVKLDIQMKNFPSFVKH
jgi:hypothetical protein